MRELEKKLIETKIDHEWISSSFECHEDCVEGYVGDVDIEIECDTLAQFVDGLGYGVQEGIDKEGEKLFKKKSEFGIYVKHTGAILAILDLAMEKEAYQRCEDVGDAISNAMYDVTDGDGFRTYNSYYTSQFDCCESVSIGPVKVYVNLLKGEDGEFNEIEFDTNVYFQIPSIRVDMKDWDKEESYLDVFDALVLIRDIVLEQFAKECELEEDDLRNAFPGEEPFRGLEKWIESKFETIEYATYLFEVADYVLKEYENGELDEED